ncbi:MAG: hypothetical protein DRP67_02300 [Candidatus Omnitrophota bacterium]|nr:MAG: hypothetical protein DRP67_02300 [Candidatus Omnitrophota bacterium]
MKYKKLLFSILFLGFLIRIIFLFQFKDTCFFNTYLMDKHDQKTFILWAEKIQKSPFYVDGKIFYMAPLYPYFLALLLSIFRGNLLLVSFFQLLIDLLLCYFLYLLGKKINDEKTGIIAASFACFYRTFIVYAGSILSDSFILFLYISFILSIYLSLEKPSLIKWILSGIILGLSALSKPTIGIYLPFLLTGLLIYPENLLPHPKFSKRRQGFFVFLILLITSGFTILPFTIRNYIVGKDFVPICSNGPVNWKIGNSADSLGLFCYPKGPLLSPFSLPFWKLFFKKLVFFFTNYEWPQNLNVYLVEKVAPVLKFAFFHFGFIVSLGIAGTFLLFKNWKKNFLFISFTFTNILWVVLFFVTDRYRLPAVGCLMVSASYLLVWIVEKIKVKDIKKIITTSFFVGIFYFIFNNTPGSAVRKVDYEIFSFLTKKNVFYELKNGNIEKAKIIADKFAKLLPENPDAHFLLGCVYVEMGKKKEAIEELKKAINLNPDFELAKKFLKELEQSF